MSHPFLLLGTPACDLNALLGKDSASWALTSAGKVMSNGMIVGKVETKIQEGDIIVSGYLITCPLKTLSISWIDVSHEFNFHRV